MITGTCIINNSMLLTLDNKLPLVYFISTYLISPQRRSSGSAANQEENFMLVLTPRNDEWMDILKTDIRRIKFFIFESRLPHWRKQDSLVLLEPTSPSCWPYLWSLLVVNLPGQVKGGLPKGGGKWSCKL